MPRATVDLALAVFKDPGLLADLRERPVPGDIGKVIRIAAGEQAAREAAAAESGATSAEVVEACVFFLQQTLFASGGDSYRVLGTRPDDPQERLREHYRWLMKWLHPDRNPDGWEALYADRVNAAWQDLKTPDRRADYDQRAPAAPQAMVPSPTTNWRLPAADVAQRGPWLSGRIVRNLPAIVLGSLAAAAMLVVGATYWARTATERERAAREAARDRPAVDAGAPQVVQTEIPQPVESMPPSLQASAAPPDGNTAALAWEDVSAAAPLATETPAVMASTSATIDEPPVAAVPVAAAPTVEPQLPVAATALTDIAAAIAENVGAPATQAAAEIPPAQPARNDAPGPSVAAAGKPAEADTVAGAEPPARPASASAPTPPAMPPPTVRAVAETRVQPGPVPPTGVAEPALEPVAERSPAMVARREGVSATEPSADVAKLPPEPARIAPARANAEALMREFIAAYAAGDLGRFDRLLSADGRGQATLLDMRRRLDSTDMRFLEITRVQWQLDSDSARASATYRDTYVPRGSRKAVTEAGRIDWDIRIEDGNHRIAGIERNVLR